MSQTIRPKPPVALTDYFLKEKEDGSIVVQGIVDPACYENIGCDSYQRELGTPKQRQKILDALKHGDDLPPVELGMRGARTKDLPDGGILLQDDVYAIDGRQRIGTLIEWILAHPDDTRANLSCVVYLNTTFKYEQAKFNALNLGRRNVSPSKIFANVRDSHPGIAAVYGLTVNDKTFAVHGKVSWDQNMKRHDLLTGRNMLIIAAHLHSHLCPSRSYTNESLQSGLEHIVKTFGIQTLKENLRVFFDVVDQAWGVRSVQFKGGTTQLKAGFLLALARLFSDHFDFWSKDGKELQVVAELRARLKGFSLDREVIRLVDGGSQSRTALRYMMREAINYRRKNKLKERGHVRDTEVEIAA
jgi:hypothetical protein